MAFTIHEASLEDTLDMAKIYVAAHIDNDIWKPMTKKVTYEDHVAWLAGIQRSRHNSPNRKPYKVIETATG